MLRQVPSYVVIAAVRAYQGMLRPFLMGSCPFHPSCSEYAIEALTNHGLIRGGGLTIRRLLRCRPFSIGGIDPVPPARQSTETARADAAISSSDNVG